MLQRTTGRGGFSEIEAALQSEYVRGPVGIFGDCHDAIIEIASKRDVTRVFVFTTNPDAVPRLRNGLNRAVGNKIEQVMVNPFRACRKDIDYTQLEYAFADLSDEPWDLQRVATMKAIAREFRPRRLGYRWQELDIAAEWVGAGNSLEAIKPEAIDIFRLVNSLMIEHRTDDYVRRCAEMTSRFMGAGR